MSKEMREQIDRIKNWDKSENQYYRATIEFNGNDVIFEPTGYYEAFDDEGNPQFHTGDVIAKSNIPEISASKTIGGALLGVWSMLRHHGSLNKDLKIYIYSINEKPNKDLVHVGLDDFEWIKEVRYKKAVNGHYIGYFIFDDDFNKNAENFYNRITSEPWDEFTEEEIEMWEDFERFLLTANKSNLKQRY